MRSTTLASARLRRCLRCQAGSPTRCVVASWPSAAPRGAQGRRGRDARETGRQAKGAAMVGCWPAAALMGSSLAGRRQPVRSHTDNPQQPSSHPAAQTIAPSKVMKRNESNKAATTQLSYLCKPKTATCRGSNPDDVQHSAAAAASLGPGTTPGPPLSYPTHSGGKLQVATDELDGAAAAPRAAARPARVNESAENDGEGKVYLSVFISPSTAAPARAKPIPCSPLHSKTRVLPTLVPARCRSPPPSGSCSAASPALP